MSNSNEINKRLSQLSPTRKALLEKWERHSFSDKVRLPTISKHLERGPIALSFAQQRLWFLHQLESQTPYYTTPLAVRLQGLLRIEQLEQSLNEIIRRHDALRTTFALNSEVPVQVVSPSLILSIPIIDLTQLPRFRQESELTLQITAETKTPFDLESGPLLRPYLFRFSPQEHVFLLTMHHIITDGWSSGILVRELNTLYNAFSAGKSSPLKDLTIQYADYTLWQREQLRSEVLQSLLAYWRKQLNGAPTAFNLLSDYPRPAVESFRGAIYSLTFPQGLLTRLQMLNQREGVTIFMTLLAAFQCLLARYTSQEDIVIGTPIANRTNTEIEDLIGCFVNTLVLRTDLSGNPSFRELLGRVREICLEAYAHQDLPFEKLVEELQPERDMSRNPLFQIMFVLQNTSPTVLELEGLTVSDIAFGSERARFDLTLSVEEITQGLRVQFEYNTDLFEESTIARMAGHYQTLLESIIDQPSRLLDELPLLTEKERQQVLIEWNTRSAPSLEESTFHSLFEAQVLRTPEAIALVTENQKITYSELNKQANQLASVLRRAGVGPDVLTALLYERGSALLVAILAVFKTGGAYLPLDPEHPAARQRQMIEASGTRLVLTTTTLMPMLSHILIDVPEKLRPQVWYIEEVMRQTSEIHAMNVSISAISHQLSYVLYTSGSTGHPKGAMIEQPGMLNHLQAKITDLQLTATDIVAQNASQCFDISIWQLLAALLVGGKVHIFSDAIAHAPLHLLLQMEQQQITILEIVPSMLQAMLEVLENTEEARNLDFAALRWLILTGEALPPSLCQRWLSHYPHIPIMNAYGPTECSDDVTHYAITHPLEKNASITPIGQPVINMQHYVLDQHLEPVPIGVIGEIYVGGVGVGRGYLHDAQRTAESFIPNPFGKKSGARLYKTGDSARYRGDGMLEYLGRLDHQVKLRGYRIELGEIEAALSRHQNILQCIALLHENPAKEKILVAYVVFKRGKTHTNQELRHFLKQLLPEPMIPSTFVSLETLPLTSNGKVDRHRLPEPQQGSNEVQIADEIQRTLTEEVIAGIWADVLKIEHVGTYSNFFELGGHSLLATQILARVREAFQIEIPLRALFTAPTLAGFVAYVEETKWEKSKGHLPAVVRNPHGNEASLSFAQQRLWFLEQWEPETPLYNMPMATHVTGRLNIMIFEQSLNEILQRHKILRSAFLTREGKTVQIAISFSPLSIPIIDLSNLSESERAQEIRRLTVAEVHNPFDLAQGPLFRAYVLRVSGQEHVILLNMHHIVADGWSLTILMEELGILYEAFSLGRPSPLGELPLQYTDYVHWQRQCLQDQVLQSHIAYWKEQLANLPTLELPIDRPRSTTPTTHGATHTFVLHQTLVKELRTLCRREGVTLFMVLLATFQMLLSYYSGQEDIVVGTDIANRPRAEFEKVIGLFINMLVLRTNLSGTPTFHAVLQRVRHVCLEAYAHQDLPFERLVHLLNPRRGLSSTPLFQACIALQNIPWADLTMGDLVLERMDIPEEMTKYDLLLVLDDTQQDMKGWLGYATDLFNHSTIVNFIEDFEALLLLVTTHVNMPLSEIKEKFVKAKQVRHGMKIQSTLENARQKLSAIRQKAQDRASI